MAVSTTTSALLSFAAGFDVVASDGPFGVVETPLYPPDAAEPDFLVVRVAAGPRTRRPVVSTLLVQSIDLERRSVLVRGPKSVLAALPEHLPIAH
ncbi:MAG TPA: hypothetical protein VFL58_13680 [Gaiellaceae bacterium]|jgi:hypothetical protein|nr:hypothetical protein [Gaiellaceae bacterium]